MACLSLWAANIMGSGSLVTAFFGDEMSVSAGTLEKETPRHRLQRRGGVLPFLGCGEKGKLMLPSPNSWQMPDVLCLAVAKNSSLKPRSDEPTPAHPTFSDSSPSGPYSNHFSLAKQVFVVQASQCSVAFCSPAKSLSLVVFHGNPTSWQKVKVLISKQNAPKTSSRRGTT